MVIAVLHTDGLAHTFLSFAEELFADFLCDDYYTSFVVEVVLREGCSLREVELEETEIVGFCQLDYYRAVVFSICQFNVEIA